MAVADRAALPLAVYAASAAPHEVSLVGGTLAEVLTAERPARLIGDKAYDSDPLDEELRGQGIKLIAPPRANRSKPPTQGGRPLESLQAAVEGRWKFAWLQNFRRIAMRFDFHNENYLGWAVSESLEAGFVERAFLQGQSRRGLAVSPLIHSDRGSQYASDSFRERLSAWGCRQSMSRRGNCWDNAVTESFFGNLKSEMVHHERFATRQEAKDKIFDYIEVFYNRSRIHSAGEYFAPAEYEVLYRAQLKQAA